jgi:hypothetical protein
VSNADPREGMPASQKYVEELRAAERKRALPMNEKLQFLSLPGVREMLAAAFDAGAEAAKQQHEQRQAARKHKEEQNT